MDRETIKVSVRVGSGHDPDPDSRHILFTRPERISEPEIRGCMALLDGDQVVFTIGPGPDPTGGRRYFYPFFGEQRPRTNRLRQRVSADSLPEALVSAKSGLAAFLNEHGYDVEFA